MATMQVSKFKDYITEAKKDFLRLLIITDEPEEAKTFHTADRLQEECDKLGYPPVSYTHLTLPTNREV